MGWTTKDMPNLSGRTAVVTGANGGLGLETARALAGAGAHVVMAAREPKKTAAAEADIRRSHPKASVEVVPMDLASLASVRTAAERILSRHDRIDILVNNAGVMACPERQTEDGFEMQFGVNHLGHFALTSLLLRALLRAEAARVVSVTEHRAPHGTRCERGEPSSSRTLLSVDRLWTIEARQFPLRARASAAFRGERRQGVESRCASRSLEHGPAGEKRARDRRGREPKILSRARGSHRHDAGGRRPPSDPSGDGSSGAGRRDVCAALHQLRRARPPSDLRRLGLSSSIDKLWQVSERETKLVIDVGQGAR